MKETIFFLFLLNLSCKPSYVEVYIEKIPSELSDNKNRFDLDNIVYPLNKEFMYSFSFSNYGEKINSALKTIKMTIEGTTEPFSNFDATYSQTVIRYEYFDKVGNRLHRERTGLVENDKNIWIHPLRMDDAGILQLSAFPFILPNKKHWIWNLDASFQNYQDAHLTHTYEKRKPFDYKTDLGILKCTPIEAITTSHLGTSTSKFLYNKKLGFVRLEFNNIDDSTIVLELIEIN